MTRRILAMVSILFALTGVVWIGQGIGMIPGSFMTGQPIWAVIGAALLVVSVVLLRWGSLR